MFHRKYALLCFLITISCSSISDREKELKAFLTQWSVAMSNRDESVVRFYDPKFILSKAILNNTNGLRFYFDLDETKILISDDHDEMQANVPFVIISPENKIDNGVIDLTITKTDKGFRIVQMSQDLTIAIKEAMLRQTRNNPPAVDIKNDSILGGIQAISHNLRQHYDSVVFYTQVNSQLLFYVVNGAWEFPYDYNIKMQRDRGNYKMGVVTAENKVIIPIAYTKIYNPDGSFKGMIEVEDNKARGLFLINGQVFIPAEFDGIYPTAIPGVIAQVKKGDNYGWVSHNGVVSFDSTSHENKVLFKSPIETRSVLQWEFKFPGDIKPLINLYAEGEEPSGVIIYPSYIRDLEITPIGDASAVIETTDVGMGMTAVDIKFEYVESISDKIFALISFFMESGVSGRDYYTGKNDLLVIDKNMAVLNQEKELLVNFGEHDPCSNEILSSKTVSPGLYETRDRNGQYKYHQVKTDGSIEQLTSKREYDFTKYARIDESYFNRCRYEHLDSNSGNGPNVVVMTGYSTEEIDIMRNEIFAEYGYIFKVPKWRAYFESKKWYKPQYDNVDKFLTEIDKANIKFILEYQLKNKDLKVRRDSITHPWAG